MNGVKLLIVVVSPILLFGMIDNALGAGPTHPDYIYGPAADQGLDVRKIETVILHPNQTLDVTYHSQSFNEYSVVIYTTSPTGLAQLVQRGANVTGWKPTQIKNSSSTVDEYLYISAWHKNAPLDASLPWFQNDVLRYPNDAAPPVITCQDCYKLIYFEVSGDPGLFLTEHVY